MVVKKKKGQRFIVSVNIEDRLVGRRASLKTHHSGKPWVRVACSTPTPQPTWKTLSWHIALSAQKEPTFPEPSNLERSMSLHCCVPSVKVCMLELLIEECFNFPGLSQCLFHLVVTTEKIVIAFTRSLGHRARLATFGSLWSKHLSRGQMRLRNLQWIFTKSWRHF